MGDQPELEAAKTAVRPPDRRKSRQLSPSVSKSKSAPLSRSSGRGPVQRGGVSYITLNVIRRSSGEHELHRITSLDLNGLKLARKIMYIENLDSLGSLRSLNLSHNEIERVERLAHLHSLVELDVSCNRLASLSGLESLVRLRTLNLEGNHISVIPAWLPRKLKQLHTLALARNCFGSLHEVSKLQQLPNLTFLTVADNPMSKLPYCTLFTVYHLRTLENLDTATVSADVRRQAVERFSCVEVERLEAELFEEREKIIRMEEETSAMKAAFSGERGPTVSLQGEDTLSKLQLELRMKNELLTKKTSELALSHQRQYELEQEMTFYKLDAKFDRSRLSELESLLHTSSDFDPEAVDVASSSREAPYLGRARYKPNSIASEGFIHATPLVGVHQTVPPPEKPTVSKLDRLAAPQTAVIENSSHLQEQFTFSLQAMRRLLSELQRITRGRNTEKDTISPPGAIHESQMPTNDEDLDSLAHELDTQMNQLRRLLQDGEDAASELEAQKALAAAQLEKMTLELETLRAQASCSRVESSSRQTQTDVLASDDEKLIFELQTKLSKMERELAQHKAAARSLQEEVKQLHLDKLQLESTLQQQLDRTPLDMAEASSQTDHTHATVTALEKRVATLDREREGLQSELLGRTRELETAMQDLMSLQEELEAAASRRELAREQGNEDAVVNAVSVACQTAPLPDTAQASMPETLSTPEQMQQLVSLLTELSEKLQNSLRDRDKQELKPRLQSEDPGIVMKLLHLLQEVYHLRTLLQGRLSGRRRTISASRVNASRSFPEMRTHKQLVSWKNGATASPNEHRLQGVPHYFVSTSTPKEGHTGQAEGPRVYQSVPSVLESHKMSQMATRSTFEDPTEYEPSHHVTSGQASLPFSTLNESTLRSSFPAGPSSNPPATETLLCNIPEHQCLEAEVTQLRDCLEEIQLKAEETLQNSRSLHATIEQQTSGLYTLHKQRESLSREITGNEHLLDSQARELEVRRAELKKAEEKLKTILRKQVAAEQQLQRLTPSLERDKVGQLSDTAASVAQKRRNLQALVVECSSLEARKLTLAESIKKQQVLYGELATSIDRQESRLAEMSGVLAELEGRRKAREEEVGKMQEESGKMQQSARLIASDVRDLKSQKARLVAGMVEEQAALSAVKLQVQKHRAALRQVKEAQARAQSNLSRCRRLTQEAKLGHNSRAQQTQEQLQSAARELEAVQSRQTAATQRLKELQSAIAAREEELRGWGQKVGEREVTNRRLQQEQERRQQQLESYGKKIQTARELDCSQGDRSLEIHHHTCLPTGLSSRLEELGHRNEKLVQDVHGMKNEARQLQNDREKERARHKAAIRKAREEKAALEEELQRARHEIDQVRAVSSTEEGLPGQYGRQVERLAGSVASTQQQYQALQSQLSSTTSVDSARKPSEEFVPGVSESLAHLEDSHQRIMEQLQADNAGLRSDLATLRGQQEERLRGSRQQLTPVAVSTPMAVSTPVAVSIKSTEPSPKAVAALEEDWQVRMQAEQTGSSLDASLHLQRRLLAARQELTDSRLCHLRTRIASLEGQLKGRADVSTREQHSEPQPLNIHSQQVTDRRPTSSTRHLKDFQAKLEASKMDTLRLVQRPRPTS